ncbi:IS701 family transposase [Streptomyces flaveolus]|uniref:IS701 family transposase n=1 Tax=Streptomyces flaveolus TaxID=67297 RepID=UPI003700E483
MENAQVAVYLTYTSRHGHAGIDRALYLPKSWTGDVERRERAAVPDEVGITTKPQLAQQMIERALDAGTPAARAAGDEIYGDNPKLRAALETCETGLRARGLVHQPRSHPGRPAARRPPGQEDTAPRLAEAVRRTRREGPPLVRLGAGRHRHRPAGHQHLLIRRNRTTGEPACYCYSPRPVPLSTLVTVAGSRWTVEEMFQSPKGLTVLDEHQVRRWDSGTAGSPSPCSPTPFLAVTTALERREQAPPEDGTSPDGLIPLTCNEIQRLFITLIVQPVRDTAHRLRRPTWRRRHPARARHSHYRRQVTLHP